MLAAVVSTLQRAVYTGGIIYMVWCAVAPAGLAQASALASPWVTPVRAACGCADKLRAFSPAIADDALATHVNGVDIMQFKLHRASGRD